MTKRAKVLQQRRRGGTKRTRPEKGKKASANGAYKRPHERQDWIPRLKIIVEEGAERPFGPVDPVAFRKTLKGKQLPELLQIFAERRATSLKTLEAMRLTDADLDRAGTHPELGRVDLGALLATWAVHDLNHLGQIVRVMAKRYETTVGPWKPYLGILNWK